MNRLLSFVEKSMVHQNASHPTGDTATQPEAFRHSVLLAGGSDISLALLEARAPSSLTL